MRKVTYAVILNITMMVAYNCDIENGIHYCFRAGALKIQVMRQQIDFPRSGA